MSFEEVWKNLKLIGPSLCFNLQRPILNRDIITRFAK